MGCEIRNIKGCVHLEGEVNIYAAPMLKDKLLQALRTNIGNAVIDLSKVSEMDTAGLQMLVVARRFSIAGGGDLQIVNPSEPAREVLELCGLDKLIVVAEKSKRGKGGKQESRSAAP